MNKKLMILVAGALTALAFMSLAGAASAKETKLKCEGAGACTFTATSGETKFSIQGGDTVACSASSGSGQVTGLDANRESTTSTVQLLFTGCKEQNTIFKFNCQNTATNGNITTNVMTVHNIALPGTPTGAGALLTNAGVTFTCAGGFASTEVTGSIIGEYEKECGPESTNTKQTINFGTSGDGVQNDTSYTGTTFNLLGKTNHASGGTNVTGAQSGTGTLAFNQSVELTCA
jgi:hypothetical protein